MTPQTWYFFCSLIRVILILKSVMSTFFYVRLTFVFKVWKNKKENNRFLIYFKTNTINCLIIHRNPFRFSTYVCNEAVFTCADVKFLRHTVLIVQPKRLNVAGEFPTIITVWEILLSFDCVECTCHKTGQTFLASIYRLVFVAFFWR